MSKLHTEKSKLVQFENDSLNTEKQKSVRGGFYFSSPFQSNSSSTYNSKLNTYIRCNFELSVGRRW